MTRSTTGEVGQLIEPLSERLDARDVKRRHAKHRGYSVGNHSPSPLVLEKADKICEGSRGIFEHVLWTALNLDELSENAIVSLLCRLSPEVQQWVWQTDHLALSRRLRLSPFDLGRALHRITRCANLDAIACLVILLREAAAKQSSQGLAYLISRELCRCVTLAGSHLRRLRIEQALADYLDACILQLGAFRGRWMSFEEYEFQTAIDSIAAALSERLGGRRVIPQREKTTVMCAELRRLESRGYLKVS